MSPDPLHGWGLGTRLLGTRPHMVNVDEVGIDKGEDTHYRYW